MKNGVLHLVLDRVEEGIAVLVGEDGKTYDVPLASLPAGSREGSHVDASAEEDGKPLSFTLISGETGENKERLLRFFSKSEKSAKNKIEPKGSDKMKTKAVRLHSAMDLRLEEIELPEIRDDEILACVISDSICMSSHKAVKQGSAHKRVPDDVEENPVIIGHEFCGRIEKVGAKWADKFKAGDKFVIQPALNYKGSLAALLQILRRRVRIRYNPA